MSILSTRLFAGALALSVIGCGGYSGTHPTGTGPFDSRGNYIESWADNPSKWNGRSVPTTPAPQEKPTQVAQVTQHTPPPVVQASPRPTQVVKPKPTPKPKPKPSTRYHTVRKGDTLYGLSKRYGTTVGAIQKANGIKGSVIRLGQRLKIPR